MMLKFFFWILLLANAGLLAYQLGYFDTLLPSGREPTRMNEQINADKIRLIPAPPPAPVAPPEQVPPVTSVAKKSEVIACAEFGNFNPDEARRFGTQLASLAPAAKVSQRALQEVASHMVYIPPQADKEGAEKKASELRRMGIEDFFVIQDNSSLRWGISLGVFKQEEAARAHLSGLNQKGVRSARIGQRTVTSNQVAFQLRELDAETKNAIDKIKADFPKLESRRCD